MILILSLEQSKETNEKTISHTCNNGMGKEKADQLPNPGDCLQPLLNLLSCTSEILKIKCWSMISERVIMTVW